MLEISRVFGRADERDGMAMLRLVLRARRNGDEADKDEGEEKAAKHHGGRLRLTLIRCLPATG
jgi:hypothetical protein